MKQNVFKSMIDSFLKGLGINNQQKIPKQKNGQTIKLTFIVLGSSCVGKSACLNKYIKKQFKDTEPTLSGSYLFSKIQKFHKNKDSSIELHLWDTAGQQKYRIVLPIYIGKSADSNQIFKLCMIFFDVTNRESFQQVEIFMKIWNENALQNNSIMLIANKIDLVNYRKISTLQAFQFAQKHQILYIESSSKQDVSHIFQYGCLLKISQLGLWSQSFWSQQIEKANMLQNLLNTPQTKLQILTVKWKQIIIQLENENLYLLRNKLRNIQYLDRIEEVSAEIMQIAKNKISQKVRSLQIISFSISYYTSSNQKGVSTNQKDENQGQYKKLKHIQGLKLLQQRQKIQMTKVILEAKQLQTNIKNRIKLVDNQLIIINQLYGQLQLMFRKGEHFHHQFWNRMENKIENLQQKEQLKINTESNIEQLDEMYIASNQAQQNGQNYQKQLTEAKETMKQDLYQIQAIVANYSYAIKQLVQFREKANQICQILQNIINQNLNRQSKTQSQNNLTQSQSQPIEKLIQFFIQKKCSQSGDGFLQICLLPQLTVKSQTKQKTLTQLKNSIRKYLQENEIKIDQLKNKHQQNKLFYMSKQDLKLQLDILKYNRKIILSRRNLRKAQYSQFQAHNDNKKINA